MGNVFRAYMGVLKKIKIRIMKNGKRKRFKSSYLNVKNKVFESNLPDALRPGHWEKPKKENLFLKKKEILSTSWSSSKSKSISGLIQTKVLKTNRLERFVLESSPKSLQIRRTKKQLLRIILPQLN